MLYSKTLFFIHSKYNSLQASCILNGKIKVQSMLLFAFFFFKEKMYHCVKQYGIFSKKLKIELPHDPAISLLAVCVHAQSCPALCNPVDHSSPGSSVHVILQTRTPECVAISYSRGSSQPRDQTHISCRQILLALCHLGSHIPKNIQKDTCTPIFIAALFTVAKIWKQTKRPSTSTNEWIKKMWYVYTMEY